MGGKSTTTTNVPPATAAELELQGLSVEEKKLQIDALKSQSTFQRELSDFALPEIRAQAAERAALNAAVSPEDRAAFAKAEFERSQRLGPIQDELLQRQLEDIRRGGAATPEQIARIDESTRAGFAAGSADIDTATEEGLKLLREELAPGLGLRPSDSPILDRGATLAREGVRQKSALGLGLQSAAAAAKLNYPLAATQVFGAQRQAERGFGESVLNFQQQLQQQAFQNRLALGGQITQGGLGLAGGGGSSALDAMTRARYAAAGTSTSREAGLSDYGAVAAGLGALIKASDIRLKKNIVRIGTHRPGVGIYRYTIFGKPEVGVMAQEVMKVRPDAVVRHPNGYLMVDYGKIGAVHGC